MGAKIEELTQIYYYEISRRIALEIRNLSMNGKSIPREKLDHILEAIQLAPMKKVRRPKDELFINADVLEAA